MAAEYHQTPIYLGASHIQLILNNTIKNHVVDISFIDGIYCKH